MNTKIFLADVKAAMEKFDLNRQIAPLLAISTFKVDLKKITESFIWNTMGG